MMDGLHVYRYRSSNLLSQKGLLYDEWYFASKEELNDPIDMQSNFEFNASAAAWTKALSHLWPNKLHASIAAQYFSELSPASYDHIVLDFDKHERSIIEKVFLESPLTMPSLAQLQDSLANLLALLKLYGPGSGYSVSLSKTNTETLMWSHYASSHTGFCLIYRPVNGRLNQCPKRKKDSLNLSREHSSSIPTAFKVEPIIYDDQPQPLDAYSLLPTAYSGYSFESEELRLAWHRKVKEQLLTKNECWSYEQECRLMLPQPSRWISGNSTYNSLQRLFYYDFNQVVGVIFGARMTSHDKEAVRNIIDHKLKTKFSTFDSKTEAYIFDFLYQQAEICTKSRKVKLTDLEINMFGTEIVPGTAQYSDRLSKWAKGEGVVMKNGSFCHDDIP